MAASVPPKNLGVLAPAMRDAVLSLVRLEGDPLGRVWQEKLRRFASLYGRRLRAIAKRRFGNDADVMVGWIGHCMVESAAVSEYRGRAPADPAFLNAAAFCVDAMSADGSRTALDRSLSAAIETYRAWLLEHAPQPPTYIPLGPEFEYVPGRWRRESEAASGVVIIAPTAFSLFTISILELCVHLNVHVAAIILRRFTFDRLRQEWQRDGTTVLKKIWRKIILRRDENSEQADISLKSVHASLGVGYLDVRSRAAALGIPVILVDGFNQPPSELTALTPRLALFTGGGLISPAFLSAFSDGVINIHHGHLPHYKGMDVVHAPVLEGRFDSVGMTAHFMSSNLDEGPVLERCSINPQSYTGINVLRNAVSGLMPLLAIDAMLGFFSKRLRPITQPNEGRQYYLGHARLNDALNSCLAVNAATGDVRLRDNIAKFTDEFGRN